MHRVGRFKVHDLFLQPDNICLRRLMAKVIVMDVRRQWNQDSVEYIGYCDEFDEVPVFEITPEYEVICEGDPIVVTFKRRAPNGSEHR